MAHGDIGVVAAQKHLLAGGDHPALAVDAGVDDGLCPAGAHGLDLGDGVRHLKQPGAAREQVGEKVGAQAEAQYRHIVLVHQCPQLVDLLRGEKLALVGDDDVGFFHPPVQGAQVGLRRDGVCLLVQADAAADDAFAVPGVHRGLDEPHPHTQLLIIELGDERLSGLGAAHGAVFKV